MKKTTKLISVTLFLMFIAQFSIAQTKENIAKANAKGNNVFLVVTDGATKLTEAKTIANNAQKKNSKTTVVTMDKSDKANAELITKYSLAGASMPLILVIAPNGVVAGGYILEQATPEKLVQAIPSKKQADVLLAFSQGKSVFIVLSKKSMKDKALAIAECNKSCLALKNNAIVVEIDLDDKNEAGFIKLINPDLKATTTNVMVFNSRGQFASSFLAPVKSADLVAAANKKAGGCSPGGCGSNSKGCGK